MSPALRVRELLPHTPSLRHTRPPPSPPQARLLAAIDARAEELEASLASKVGAAAGVAAAAEEAVALFRAEIGDAVAARPTKAAVAAELRKKASRADVDAMLSAQAEAFDASLAAKADEGATSAALAARASKHELEVVRAERPSHAELAAARAELKTALSAARVEAISAAEEAQAACARLAREATAGIADLRGSLAIKASVTDMQAPLTPPPAREGSTRSCRRPPALRTSRDPPAASPVG